MSNSSVGGFKFAKGEVVDVLYHIGAQLIAAGRGVLIPDAVKKELNVDVKSAKTKVDIDVDLDIDNVDAEDESFEAKIEDIVEDIVENIVEDVVDGIRDNIAVEQGLKDLSWGELIKLAKEKGIKTYQVKRPEIEEKLLQVFNNEQ